MIWQKLWQKEAVRIPVLCLGAVVGGFLLSVGTVSGVASPLAAAMAGCCEPLYAFCILLGSLGAYAVSGASAGMHYLLTFLVCVTCVKILLRENFRPHTVSFLTAVNGIAAGFLLDLVFYGGSGRLPLYIAEAMLTGVAAYFIADAVEAFGAHRRITLGAGRSFTFALCYLLIITALCGLDFPLCNVGRIAGITVTLLGAKQFRQNGGTLCGALTACGVVLCSVKLGMPLLFLPVTAMLAGFLYKLPNALFIPVFFLMQFMSSAVLDSSIGLAKIAAELLLSCGVYALCSHVELHRFLCMDTPAPVQSRTVYQEQLVGEALAELREETAAVMHRLTIAEPEDAVKQVRSSLCGDCKNRTACWRQQGSATEQAFRLLLHEPDREPCPAAIRNCLRKEKLRASMKEAAHRTALQQMQRVHMLQNRAVTLEYLHLLEDLAADSAKRRAEQICIPETESLRRILQQCACPDAACFVYRMRSGRYAAEIYTRQTEFPVSSVQTLLAKSLGVPVSGGVMQQNSRICFYQTPPYHLTYAVRSVNAPACERCGDHADGFTDAVGDQYIVLSDGMGSGSTASLASRIAVRTFRRMVCSGMPAETAIRLVNTMLLTETNTENFATLDVLMLHADSGELTLYKSGAAATLFSHGGQVQRIASGSFPVGIVPDAMPSRKHMTAAADDAVVMLSDGIGEAEYPYIKQLLWQDLSLEEITQAVCEKAAIFHGGEVRDDMTVIIARLCAECKDEIRQIDKKSMPESLLSTANA